MKQLLNTMGKALAQKDLTRNYDHFCFTEDSIISFNDFIGFKASLPELTIQGCFNGALLLNILNSINKEPINFEVIKGILKIKSGKTKAQVKGISEKDYVFEYPTVKPDDIVLKFNPEEDFIKSLEEVSLSMSTDYSVPARYGITMIAEESSIDLYASDDTTITSAFVEVENKRNEEQVTILIPPHFVKTFIDTCKTYVCKELIFTSNYVIAKFNNDLEFFGKLVSGVDSEMYLNMFDELFNDELEEKFIKIPEDLKEVLNRATILTGADIQIGCNFIFDGKKLQITSVDARGSIEDEIKFKGDIEGTFKTSPFLLNRGLSSVDKFYVTEKAFIFSGTGFYYFVALMG